MRIIEYRTAHGRFTSVEELREVSGIGPAKFAEIRSRVRV
jgi:competence protein ComEA